MHTVRGGSAFVIINDGDTEGSCSGDSGNGLRYGCPNRSRGRDQFVQKLDAKLKKLQQQRQTITTTNQSGRPLFITTVKTGVFLDPPPDLAILLGLDNGLPNYRSKRSYYSYSSKPQILYDKHHRHCTLNEQPSNMCKQGYTNIMHDKRVVRGSNFAKKPSLNNDYSDVREAEARRRAIVRKKAMDYQSKALRLHLGGPKMLNGRQHDVNIQTDKHLEELYEYPPSQTFGSQTEDDVDYELSNHPGSSGTIGTDASIQVDEKDLFDFDTAVSPVIESLITNTFKQALQEILYEDELDTLLRQQRIFHSKHTNKEDNREMKRLENYGKTLSYTVEKTKNTIKDRIENNRISDQNNPTKERIDEVINEIIRITESATKLLKNSEFLPWLEEEIQKNHSQKIDYTNILKNMIDKIMENHLMDDAVLKHKIAL
ncbi:radial spoke head protein 3 homolog B isoform X2 [Daktulosphaira vitifoliae]|uniref:radial spoke head protein 3 homolog B isoform X2 n=1 Tax=Daktulosphaira vitifoliae TaxID=58002 RepID=UPI0021AA58C8|nr:radial spoke head protein 3 homolog B isoform X2 [Daktulosphaira vitifoliae]